MTLSDIIFQWWSGTSNSDTQKVCLFINRNVLKFLLNLPSPDIYVMESSQPWSLCRACHLACSNRLSSELTQHHVKRLDHSTWHPCPCPITCNPNTLVHSVMSDNWLWHADCTLILSGYNEYSMCVNSLWHSCTLTKHCNLVTCALALVNKSIEITQNGLGTTNSKPRIRNTEYQLDHIYYTLFFADAQQGCYAFVPTSPKCPKKTNFLSQTHKI
jgi:hypothetical protein